MTKTKNEEAKVEEEVVKEDTEQPLPAETETETDVKSEEEAEKDIEPEETEVTTSTVTINWRPLQPEKVFIAGTFNDWNPESHPLTLGENGEWNIELELPLGTYEYRLVVDGEWICDPACEESVVNPLGSHNSLLTIK